LPRAALSELDARRLYLGQDAQQLSEFTDVRELQRQLKDRGVNMISQADENSTSPASFMIADPDGNTILVDQHV
jgi:lactoylglutathione lyase